MSIRLDRPRRRRRWSLIYAVAVYNRLVRLRALAREGFSGITVQLRRRADLVPNLVETVQGYATHERETFEQVTAHRADATGASGVEATAAADAHDDRPARPADRGRRGLSRPQGRREFPAAAERTAAASRASCRARGAITTPPSRDLNTRVQSFPDMLFAGPLGFTEEPFYQDEDAAIQTAPEGRLRAPGR